MRILSHVCVHSSGYYTKFWKPEVWVHDLETRGGLTKCVSICAWNICILLAALASACAFHILTDFFIWSDDFWPSVFSRILHVFKTSRIYFALGNNHEVVPAWTKFSKSATLGAFGVKLLPKLWILRKMQLFHCNITYTTLHSVVKIIEVYEGNKQSFSVKLIFRTEKSYNPLLFSC
jgi:hypothetical protein